MILTTHALVGASIGKNINNPWLIIIISLVIHFVLDGFRHGEYFDSRIATIKNTAWKVILDLSIGGIIIFSAIFFYRDSFEMTRNILIGAFSSMFPDLLTILFWKFNCKFLKKLYTLHQLAHRYSRFPKFSPERQWTLRNATNDIFFSVLATIILFL